MTMWTKNYISTVLLTSFRTKVWKPIGSATNKYSLNMVLVQF